MTEPAPGLTERLTERVVARASRRGLPWWPVAIAAAAVHAGLRLEMLLVAIVDQRVEAVDALDPDVAAAAAIAAVRAAELDEFLAPE